MWLYVSTPVYTVALLCRAGKVYEAPPIARWTIGKSVQEVSRYFRTKGDQVSEEDNGNDFPGVQVSTFIKGDQFVFRGSSGPELEALLKGVAESTNGIVDALVSVKQAVVAKNVFTGDSSSGNEAGGARTPQTRSSGGRAKDAPPPDGGTKSYVGEDGRKYVNVQCSHGDMLDLRGNGYRSDAYCTQKDRDKQCKPVKL